MIKLGDIVRDKITGFTGVAIARIEYLNRCIRFCVQPRQLHEGKMIDSQYFDIEQLEILPDNPVVLEHAEKERTGGDRPAPAHRADPPRR